MVWIVAYAQACVAGLTVAGAREISAQRRQVGILLHMPIWRVADPLIPLGVLGAKQLLMELREGSRMKNYRDIRPRLREILHTLVPQNPHVNLQSVSLVNNAHKRNSLGVLLEAQIKRKPSNRRSLVSWPQRVAWRSAEERWW